MYNINQIPLWKDMTEEDILEMVRLSPKTRVCDFFRTDFIYLNIQYHDGFLVFCLTPFEDTTNETLRKDIANQLFKRAKIIRTCIDSGKLYISQTGCIQERIVSPGGYVISAERVPEDIRGLFNTMNFSFLNIKQ